MTAEALELIPFSSQDQVELGARMASAGLSSDEVRTMVSIVEDAAKQLALSMMPAFMKLTQDTHVAACKAIEEAVQAQPSKMNFGYVSKAEVLMLINQVKRSKPTHT